MSLKRKILLLLSMIVVFTLTFSFLSSCSPTEEETKPAAPSDDNDGVGNLLIRNYSASKLVLYKGEEALKTIPDDSSDFIVNIETTAGATVDLRLYKYSDVSNNFDEPDSEDMFKRWVVPLDSDTGGDRRCTWTVLSESTDTAGLNSTTQGTIKFDYYGSTVTSNGNVVDIYVDVFLDSTTGPLLMSLKGGQQDRRAAVDLGNRKIVYQYWTSDQNTTEGRKNLGSISKEQDTAGNVNPIWVILSEDDDVKSKFVPIWTGSDTITSSSPTADAKYGEIIVKNTMSYPIQIWYGTDKKIEDIVVYTEYTTNISTIAGTTERKYLLDATSSTSDENAGKSYTLTAKNLNTGAEMDRINITVYPDDVKVVTWSVDGILDN